MQKLECPLCHQRTVAGWRILFMGPVDSVFGGESITCSHCNGKIGIKLSHDWAVFWLQLGAIAVAMWLVDSVLVSSAIIAAAVAAGWWYRYRYAQLVPHKEASVKG